MLYDRDIRSMEVQAERFTVPGPEGDFDCIPDVRLIRADGVIEFREFKQDIEALTPEERERLQRIQAHLQGLGYSYTVEDARSCSSPQAGAGGGAQPARGAELCQG